jgi:hypothetical protein
MSVEQRLARLENQNRRLRLVATVAGLTIGLLLLCGQAPTKTRYVESVLPDSTLGAVLVRIDAATGEPEYRIPKRAIESELADELDYKPSEKYPNESQDDYAKRLAIAKKTYEENLARLRAALMRLLSETGFQPRTLRRYSGAIPYPNHPTASISPD